MRGRAIVVALATAACSLAPPPDIAAIVRGEMTAATATAGPTVRCEGAGESPGVDSVKFVVAHLCHQSFTPASKNYYAGVMVKVEPASGPATEANARVVDSMVGPGGAGATVKARTRDGRYDVTASLVTTGLPADQPLRLPDAGQLLDRILARYATQSPARAP